MKADTPRGLEDLARTDSTDSPSFTFADTATFTPRIWMAYLTSAAQTVDRLTVPCGGNLTTKISAPAPDRGSKMEAMTGYQSPYRKRSEWTESRTRGGVQ